MCVKYHLRVIIVRHLRVQNGKIIESEHQAGKDRETGAVEIKVHLIIE